jgi:hypothetical protein
MVIINLINDTYQLIDESTDSVVFQGSLEDCQTVMYAEEQKRLYEEFILMLS